jgi:hypothetical protein
MNYVREFPQKARGFGNTVMTGDLKMHLEHGPSFTAAWPNSPCGFIYFHDIDPDKTAKAPTAAQRTCKVMSPF